MAHPRKLIRQAVTALLVSANTAAGARVYPTRVPPLQPGKLPAICVYTEDEEVDEASKSTAPVELKRNVELVIEAYVLHSSTGVAVDDAMDNIAEQIEAAMDADYYLSGTAGDSSLTRTETGLADTNSDPLIGIARLTYTVVYRTSSTAAVRFPTDDFKTVDAQYKVVGGVADTSVVEDKFTVQETTP